MGQNQRSQIEMTGEEMAVFIDQSRTCTMATVGPGGMPHLVAMWYAWLDGHIWLESKAKAQKIVNLRRDDRLSVMIEAGNTYETLRGITLEGRGVIVEDPDELWRVGVNVWERYTRSLLRGVPTVRGGHVAQAGGGAPRHRARPQLGPPQAGHGPDRHRRHNRPPHRRSRPAGPRLTLMASATGDPGGDIFALDGRVVR